MTDLSMVTILSLVCSVTGAGLLAVLAISLKVQGDDTDKQVWNRRMLAAGGLSYLIGLLLPLAFLPAKGASAMAIGTVMIGVLVTGLLVFRLLRRVLAALCLLASYRQFW